MPCSRRIGIARSRSRKPLPASGSRAGAMRLHHQGFVVGALGYDPDAPSLPASGIDIHDPLARGFGADGHFQPAALSSRATR